MKPLLRSFSRSLPMLSASSRTNHDHTVSLPDYYRETKREVYGPHFSTEIQFMTTGIPYDDHDEASRSSLLLDIALPGEADWETKSHMIASPLRASGTPSLSSSSLYVPIPPKTGEVNDCFRFGLALIQGFVSLFCGGCH